MIRLRDFELLELLGSGGVAEVWRARDAGSGLEVAVKRLLPQFADDRQVRRRFLREAEVAGRLSHPNIVHILGSGGDDAQPFLAMELVSGEDVGKRLERVRKLAPSDSWRIALGVARALAHAHSRGVVHRDVKPQNVLLAGDQVKLADFGLARVETVASLTGSSLLWGSPEYMAPEVFARGRIDPRTDLFSLGVLIHEMVSGRLPWKEGRSAARIAAADAGPVPVALGQGDALDRLVSALLSPSPDDRPSSAGEVIGVLEGRQAPAPVVRAAACSACGRPRPGDVPRCFSCGHEDFALRHVNGGSWTVVLEKVSDDASSMESLHRVLGELTGRDDIKLKFLVGPKELYSKEEKELAIKLPTVLFSKLDEATAKEIERRLRSEKLKAEAAKRRWLGLWTRRQTRIAAIACGSVMGWSFLSQLVLPSHARGALLLPAVCGAAVVCLFAVIFGGRDMAARPARFALQPTATPTPAATRLLGAAQQASGRLAAPEVRGLFVEASREVYRLTRRAEELERLHPGLSPEAALARRLIAATPAIATQLEALAQRLEALDAALEGDGEGDLARELAALERRLARAPNVDRPALEAALRDVEDALERRLATETERERLAAALCGLLATVRNTYRRAASISSVEERDAAAIEAALRELDAPSERYVPS
jgi:hypothetical protein